MILSPTIITYIGYSALTNDSNDRYKVLLGLVPIMIGLLSIYLWIHVKMLFDQLCKAVNTVKPSAPPLPPAKNDNLTINVRLTKVINSHHIPSTDVGFQNVHRQVTIVCS